MAVGVIDRKDVLEMIGYLQSVNSRIQSIDNSYTGLAYGMNKLGDRIYAERCAAKKELDALKSDVASLKDSVHSVQKSIILLIATLKSSVKGDDFSRLKKRIDTWAPENFANKGEAERVVDEF